MSDLIRSMAKDHILIAAHRGTAGGNIPCNTMAAYAAALHQGADIVEIDVAVSADRQLYVFHPGMEPAHLRSNRYIKDMQSEEVEQLFFVNQDGVKTVHRISKLDDVLELLKNRCIVNVDKYWTAIPEITDCIRRHGMVDQVIVKTSPDEKWFDIIEEVAPDFPYMPILNATDTVTEQLLKRNINFIGAEVLFKNEIEQTGTPEYIEAMHQRNLLLWANAIVYDYRAQLTAGHSDDEAIVGNMDDSWGWLADRGFDIIQTDWTLPMREYFKTKGIKVREM